MTSSYTSGYLLGSAAMGILGFYWGIARDRKVWGLVYGFTLGLIGLIIFKCKKEDSSSSSYILPLLIAYGCFGGLYYLGSHHDSQSQNQPETKQVVIRAATPAVATTPAPIQLAALTAATPAPIARRPADETARKHSATTKRKDHAQ